MSARAQLRDFETGSDPVTLVAGEDDLELLVPLSEPLSVGAPPVRPSLVRRIEIPGGASIRRSVGGHPKVRDREGASRPQYEISWGALTQAEHDTLRDWLDNTLNLTEFAFEVNLDDDDETEMGYEPTRVIFVGKPSDRLRGPHPGVGGGVYAVEGTVEEVF